MQVNYFHPLTFGITDSLSVRIKIFIGSKVLFKKNSTFDHLYLLKTKSRTRSFPRCSKVDSLNLH